MFLQIAGGTNSRHAELTNSNLKRYINTRYPEKLSNRMMTYFETHKFFPTLNQRINFTQFAESFGKFAEATFNQILEFSFNIFDITGDSEICEHDLFQIIDLLKQDNPTEDLIEIIKRDGNIAEEIQVPDRKNELFLNSFHDNLGLISTLIN